MKHKSFKIKNIIVIFLALISFTSLISISFNNIVSASSTYDFYDIDDSVPTAQILLSENTFLSTSKSSGSGVFYVSPLNCHSGSRSFICDSPSRGNFSFTYSSTKFITNISFWLTTEVANNHYMMMDFYNDSLGISKPMIEFYFGYGAVGKHCEYYTDSVGVAQTLALNVNNGYYQYYIEISDDIGNCYYGRVGGYRTSGTVRNATAINSNYRITDMALNNYPYSGYYMHFDDYNISYSDSYEGGTIYGCDIDLTGYNKVGIDITPQTMDLNYPLFQKVHYTDSYGFLYAISLCVNPSMFTIDPNPENYIAEVIGFNLGGADCFYNDGYQYRLVWLCNIDLGERVEGVPSGRKIDTFFRHDTLIGANKYWQVCFSDSDLDSDGEIFFKLWNDARTKIYYDVGVSYYFDPTTQYQSADSIFSDTLGLQNFITNNATGFYYDINQPEGIACSYLLSQTSASYNCKIIIMKNGSYYQNFTNLIFNSGIVGLVPDSIGTYVFKLFNYHYVYNITAYVGGTKNIYFISSNPLVTDPYQTYNIYYRYYNPLGITGAIGVFDDYSQRGSFVYAHTQYVINNNLSNYVPYPSLSLENEYLTLFTNGSYKQPVAYATHYIRDNNILENNIYVSPDTVKLGNIIMVYGTHKFPACQISVFINGIEKWSVKDEQSFNRTFLADKSDSYNISLRLKQNGSWVTLKWCIAEVTGETGEGELIFGIGIEPPYSYFAGIFIVIISTLSPLLILGIIKKDSSFDLSSIPQFLYLIMAIVGFVISILLGFFPSWSVVVLIILGALIITIMYLRGNASVG
jgi:hypothetical protein